MKNVMTTDELMLLNCYRSLDEQRKNLFRGILKQMQLINLDVPINNDTSAKQIFIMSPNIVGDNNQVSYGMS